MEVKPPSVDPYQQGFYKSTQQLSLVNNTAPFCGDYKDYNENKSFHEDNYDACSALTNNCDDSLGNTC